MTRRLLAIVPLALSLAILLPSPSAASSSGIAAVALWGGRFDALETVHSNEIGAELRFVPLAAGESPVSWRLAPAVSVMRTSKDAVFVHAGFRLDLPLTDRFTLTPQFGAGYYDPGDDKVLGGHFHFRSGLEASVRLGRRQRLGLLLYHLSNAGINDRNPGEESLVVQWAVGF